ncbi:MAG: SIMPL domain-containing protein [Bacteroidaceae bacterium]|nr:SIMPL domain-containing protein [Bacteroidaceae bacterium]
MKNFRTEAFIISVGIVLFGFIVKSAIDDFIEKERVVSVKGLAETDVPADLVVWPLVYKEAGNDPAEMYETITRKNAIIVNFLKANGITESEISVSPPSVYDKQADRYNDDRSIYRYKATSVITVTSKQVDAVRAMMQQQAELMKQGIAIVGDEYQYRVSYEFTALNDIKPSMIEEATKNARNTAEKFAKDSDSRLGKIRNANQGTFTITDSDANTPYIKHVRVVTTVTYYLEN